MRLPMTLSVASALLTTACGEMDKVQDPVASATVHAYNSDEAAIFANAYVIETANSLIVVDATLTESSSTALRKLVDSLEKPLAAVVITHGHPDHYNGLTNLVRGRDVPIYATAAVTEVIRSHDAAKEAQWRPMFGDEWPAKRTFPTHIAADGESITIDGVTLTAHALGPAESDADTVWSADLGEGESVAFIGDVAFNNTHAYTCDGHMEAWLAALERLRNMVQQERWRVLYPGHGPAGGIELLDAQTRYLELMRRHVKELGADGTLSPDDLATLQAKLEAETGVRGLGFLVTNCAPAVLAELQ